MEIKVLGICGSPVVGGNTEKYLEVALQAAAEKPGVKTELLSLAQKKIQGCIHCNWCLRKQDADKICAIDDDMTAIYPKLMEADVIFWATPVYFTRLSGQLACMMDRVRAIFHGKYYQGRMKYKIGSAFAVAWGRHAGLESTLMSINMGILHMDMTLITAGHICYGGGAAVSSIGGTGATEGKDKLLVLKDEYGLSRARETAWSAIEMARIIKKGREVVFQEQSEK